MLWLKEKPGLQLWLEQKADIFTLFCERPVRIVVHHLMRREVRWGLLDLELAIPAIRAPVVATENGKVHESV